MTNLLEPKSKKKRRAVNSHRKAAPPYLTYQQFLDWADEDTLAEWVDGRVEMTSPASNDHQRILSFLDNILQHYVEFKDLGTVRVAPFQMKITSGREPDVLFLAKAHQERLKDNFIDGPADLVVEIVSPESRKRDRVTKFDEYEQAQIPEYWYINPLKLKKVAKFYQLDAAGKYQEKDLDSEGRYFSHVLPGFWLRPTWLWQPPLPAMQTVLLEIGGADYANYLIGQLQRGGYLPSDG